MSATTAPTVALNVTESAATEIKKFMAGEEGLPETSGLRVRVVPGGCSGFQYSLNIEEQSREGDFITRIARANHLTAKQLNWYNPTATRLKNGNLHAGQRILVPTQAVVAAARDVPNPSIERYGVGSMYTVKRGDNLSLIARRHGVTVAQLRRLNRLNGDFIRIGQRLRIR